MTQPLALVLYEKLLPGSQLVNKLQDPKYRVQTLSDPGMLVECAEQAKPMVVFSDLEFSRNNACPAIARLKQTPSTAHLPVICFGPENSPELKEAALAAGVNLVVSETAILSHLPQFLEQALQL